MGTFAETAIVNYRLSFTNQGKQTSLFRFSLQQTNGRLPLLFSVCRKQKEVAFSVSSVFRFWNSGNVETWNMGTWSHGDGDIKRKTEIGSPGDFPLSVNLLLIV
jgi:hypothetical protein